jgi:hypothetical protein
MERTDSTQSFSRDEVAKVELEDGTIFYVKVQPVPGESRVSLHADNFEHVITAVEGIGKRLSKVWETLKPGKASVELGIDFTCEQGKLLALLVDGSAQASMKITLEWSGEH